MFPLEAILSAFPTRQIIRVWDTFEVELCAASCEVMIPYNYRSALVTSVTQKEDGFIDVIIRA